MLLNTGRARAARGVTRSWNRAAPRSSRNCTSRRTDAASPTYTYSTTTHAAPPPPPQPTPTPSTPASHNPYPMTRFVLLNDVLTGTFAPSFFIIEPALRVFCRTQYTKTPKHYTESIICFSSTEHYFYVL